MMINLALIPTEAALLFEPETPFSVGLLELAPPSDGEVLVEMESAGVCGSDESVWTGKRPHAMPVVCGHEGAGFVRKIGKGVTRVKEGDFVILNWQPACGECLDCKRNKPYLCGTFPEIITPERARFFTAGGQPVYSYSYLGCFSQKIVVREGCCVPIRRIIKPEIACLIGCAVTTGVGAVLNTAKVERGAAVAIFGMGGVGLSALMGAKLAGADPIIAVDASAAKQAMALELGATCFLDSTSGVAEEIRRLTKGRGADYVFDAVGKPAVTRLAFESLGPAGALICIGLPPMASEFSLPGWRLVGGEKRVLGSLYGSADTAQFFPALVDLYLDGKLPLDKLVSQVYPLSDINEAFTALRRQETGRGVIRF